MQHSADKEKSYFISTWGYLKRFVQFGPYSGLTIEILCILIAQGATKLSSKLEVRKQFDILIQSLHFVMLAHAGRRALINKTKISNLQL